MKTCSVTATSLPNVSLRACLMKWPGRPTPHGKNYPADLEILNC